MKRYLIFVSAIIALTAAADAEPPKPAAKVQLKYDVKKEKTYTGTITAVKEKQLDGNGSDITDYVFLMVRLNDTGKIIECALGPAWKVAHFVKFKKDDVITLTGVMSDYSQLLVRTAKTKTDSLTLRDARGKGVWDTSPESASDSHMGGPRGGKGGPGGPGGGAPDGGPNTR